jgi:WD40 repeat protein
VKLWNILDFDSSSSSSIVSLYEFFNPSYEYICDVSWSPSNPGLFLTTSSSGTLSVWNLSKSFTEPVNSLNILSTKSGDSSSSSSFTTNQSIALNKSIWNDDGHKLFIGDSIGSIHSLKLSSFATNLTSIDENKLQTIFSSSRLHHQDQDKETKKMKGDESPFDEVEKNDN